MEMRIRSLQRTDIDELARMEAEAFSEPWTARDFADLLTRDYCLYLVAEADGKVVGSCGLTISFDEGNIDNVVVDKEYRNRGVGSKLMKELLKLGEEKGITAFTLEVRVSNATAIHLYEKYGFVSEGIRPEFYDRPKEDAVIMWRR